MTAAPDQRPPRTRLARTGVFCYLWLIIGFVLGTIVLLFPIRWLTSALQARGASTGVENALVIGVVLLYVIASFFLARSLNSYVCGPAKRGTRLTVVALGTLVALLTAWSWRDPGRMLSHAAGGGNIASVQTAGGAIFEFGAYPDAERLEELRKSGVTTVISLQDPNIVVERDGIHEEEEATKKEGLTLIKAPMVPWFSENSESLEKIRQIATTGHGHYYVHCGLGRDRVNIVKRLIESLGAKTVATTELKQALGFEGRAADFDKGSLVSLKPGVWLVPFPEREELYGCFMEGRPGHVVVLLDSASSPQDSLLRDVHKLFPSYGIPFIVLSPANPAAAADSAKKIPPPVTVIAYRTPWHNGRQKGDEAAVAFRNAFSPDDTWRVTTGTVKRTTKANEWTGGKEKGC